MILLFSPRFDSRSHDELWSNLGTGPTIAAKPVDVVVKMIMKVVILSRLLIDTLLNEAKAVIILFQRS